MDCMNRIVVELGRGRDTGRGGEVVLEWPRRQDAVLCDLDPPWRRRGREAASIFLYVPLSVKVLREKMLTALIGSINVSTLRILLCVACISPKPTFFRCSALSGHH